MQIICFSQKSLIFNRWQWFPAQGLTLGKSVNFRTYRLLLMTSALPAHHTQETLFTVVPTVLSLSLFFDIPPDIVTPKVSIGTGVSYPLSLTESHDNGSHCTAVTRWRWIIYYFSIFSYTCIQKTFSSQKTTLFL